MGGQGADAQPVEQCRSEGKLVSLSGKALAPWPVEWIDPAPAIARRVSDLLGPPGRESDSAGAEMLFTSNKPHTLNRALMPFFGGRVLAERI